MLALCVPMSQLPTIDTQTECCCPDPAKCKCPDHDKDESTVPTMRACHRTSRDFVAPGLPAFVAPALVIAAPPAPIALTIEHALASPHSSPPPQRPDAPS